MKLFVKKLSMVESIGSVLFSALPLESGSTGSLRIVINQLGDVSFIHEEGGIKVHSISIDTKQRRTLADFLMSYDSARDPF